MYKYLNSSRHNPNFQWLSGKMAFENIVEKEENAGNQHFLLFPQYALIFQIKFHFFLVIFIQLSAKALNFGQVWNFVIW